MLVRARPNVLEIFHFIMRNLRRTEFTHISIKRLFRLLHVCLSSIHSFSLSLSLVLYSYISLPIHLISVSISIFTSAPIFHPCRAWFPKIYSSLSPHWKMLPGNNQQNSSCHRTYTS